MLELIIQIQLCRTLFSSIELSYFLLLKISINNRYKLNAEEICVYSQYRAEVCKQRTFLVFLQVNFRRPGSYFQPIALLSRSATKPIDTTYREPTRIAIHSYKNAGKITNVSCMLQGDFLSLFKLLSRQSFFTRTSECLLRMLSKLKVFSEITFKSSMIVQTFSCERKRLPCKSFGSQ